MRLLLLSTLETFLSGVVLGADRPGVKLVTLALPAKATRAKGRTRAGRWAESVPWPMTVRTGLWLLGLPCHS
jgi:hypothetical protein